MLMGCDPLNDLIARSVHMTGKADAEATLPASVVSFIGQFTARGKLSIEDVFSKSAI